MVRMVCPFNEISQKEGAATGIVIADKIKQNTNNIAAASSASSEDDGTGRKGDGQNAQLLSQFRQKVLINSGNGAVSLDGFYQSVIGQMSVDAQQANRLKVIQKLSKELWSKGASLPVQFHWMKR